MQHSQISHSYFIGGIIFIAIDLQGLREYVQINPRLRPLDSLYQVLVESDIIEREVTQRCEVEFSLTHRNLQIVLSAKTSGDQEFCSNVASTVTSVISNPAQRLGFTPDALQFATAAVVGNPISITPGNSDSSNSGAAEIITLTSLSLCVIVSLIMSGIFMH